VKSIALAAAICLSAATLVWIGYNAVTEWKRAAALVASRNSEAAADLLISALARDMRGVQTSVLATAERDGLTAGAEADLLRPIASAFARYPYPETFFAWRQSPPANSVVFFARAERYPTWLPRTDGQRLYPVVEANEPVLARRILDRVMKDAWQARRFSIFEMDVAGAKYQVVTVLSYGDALREHVSSALGFMVDLGWVRHHYFADLVAQVRSIEGQDRGMRFAVIDDRQAVVVGGAGSPDVPRSQRAFPVLFFDPLLVAIDPPRDLHISSWTALAAAEGDPTLAVANQSARRTLALAAAMTLTLAVAFVMSLKALRANANLVDLRTEFVSAVTHELKTPIANLRAISETLASGRDLPGMTKEYGAMGLGEANRLSRLVDNLLAYSRVADVADVYSFESVFLGPIVQRTLQEFASNLRDGGFHTVVDVPEDLPAVRADPTALGLMLNNLIDNAIRYSTDRRELRIDARHQARTVTIRVTDRGVGIAPDEIARVTRKFFRGRGSHPGGSGLGLAIVERIVTDHGGALRIESAMNQGTTVSVTLPIA
jgi:signal transduction histidine kinase